MVIQYRPLTQWVTFDCSVYSLGDPMASTRKVGLIKKSLEQVEAYTKTASRLLAH